jgi:putative ABC transport system permease protein
MNWLRTLFGRKKAERQLDAELRFHFDEQVKANVAAGMTDEEARRTTRLEFGGIDQIKEECRDVSRARWLEVLLQDVRYGLRSLRKSKGFTITAVATIGIGIGANAAIFSYVDGVLLRPVSYPDPGRLVQLSERKPDGTSSLVSTANFLDWERQNSVFEHVAAHGWSFVTLTGVENPINFQCERVGLHFYDIFRVKPQLGRLFVEGEDQPGHDHVVVLNNLFWRTQFSADPAIIGKTITLDGEGFTVVGVMPPGVADLTPAKMTRPLSFSPDEKSRDRRWLLAWGKLKPGVSIEQANSQMDTISKRIAHDYAASNLGWTAVVESAGANLVQSDVKRSLCILMSAVGVVLLVACANLASLTLARGAEREREAAVRAALGAGRWRLARQYLTESLLVAAAGGILGVLIAYGGLAGLKGIVPSHYMPPTKYVEIDGRILLAIAFLALATGLTFGLYPALKASLPNIRGAMNLGGLGTSTGRAHQRIRSTLVVIEVALAIVLLSAAGLLIRSFMKMQEAELGFTSTDVVVAGVSIDTKRLATGPALNAHLRKLVERVSGLPGAGDVALASVAPMQGWGYGSLFHRIGTPDPAPSEQRGGFVKIVTPSYASTVRLHLLRGRFLDARDLDGAALCAVINETMVRQYFADVDPIGQHVSAMRVQMGSTDWQHGVPWEIVGIVADERLDGLSVEGRHIPGIYVSTEQSPQPRQTLLVRSTGNPTLLEHTVPAAIHEIDANQVVFGVTTLDEIKAKSIADQRLHSLLLGIFAGLSLLLSAIGLFGVISYSVAQRTREIGIRSVLGASSGSILRLVLGSGLSLTCMGLVAGLAGALATKRVVGSMLFHVDSYDPMTFGCIVGLQVLVALMACYIPARRALKVDPVTALRSD